MEGLQRQKVFGDKKFTIQIGRESIIGFFSSAETTLTLNDSVYNCNRLMCHQVKMLNDGKL